MVEVRSPRSGQLLGLLLNYGYAARRVDADALLVECSSVDEVGELAWFFNVPVQACCCR